jgi:glyceraldehyde 3-phosphate dehydrogenase
MVRAPGPTDKGVAVNDVADAGTLAHTQVKVIAWYDNEWGFANRLVELAERVLAPVPVSV